MKTIWGRSLLLGVFLFCVTSVGLGDDRVNDTIMRLCETELVPGAGAACETYLTCREEHTEARDSCIEDLFRDMPALCDDLACEKDALLLVTTIILADTNHVYLYVPVNERQAFADNLVAALVYYKEGNYQQAGDILLALSQSYEHVFLPYAAALAYEKAGAVEAALDSYTAAIEVQFFTPLIYYSRGHFYLSLGDAERASRDFQTFNDLRQSKSYWPAPPENIPPYILPDSETWMVYELMRYSWGPGGVMYLDGFTVPGFEVEVAWLDEGRTLAIKGLLADDIWWYMYAPIPDILFFDCLDNRCSLDMRLQQPIGAISPGGMFVEITIENQQAEITLNEGGSKVYWVMLPAAVSDPRPTVPCNNGVYPRLAVNGGFQTIGRNNVYAEASKESEVIEVISDSFNEGTIIGTLVCGEEGNWWPIALPDGTSGWIPEGDGRYYRVIPADITLSFDYLLDSVKPGWKG